MSELYRAYKLATRRDVGRNISNTAAGRQKVAVGGLLNVAKQTAAWIGQSCCR